MRPKPLSIPPGQHHQAVDQHDVDDHLQRQLEIEMLLPQTREQQTTTAEQQEQDEQGKQRR